ncbi:c-type cytochrome [Dyadobacter flavalbus]|uniref:C-type cytochrome n=1 Tax=Dyadobacter flavalbus TaxID=2579942 RepID=A0A5M8QTE4_9BACT|nr:c-type cytochrome [Dyadobacter flavalbus]KAA6438320.1 c-type cytochrome [Dyadobacter flavalbus]
MKSTIAFLGLIFISSLIYNCSGVKKSAVSQDFKIPEFKPDPASTFLSPKESMQTMHLPPGYRLQLVASEPMIKEPVAIAWDGNGRMFVMEMRTYMQDADASHEQEKTSRISLLEDTDGDGVMDKSTVFIDSLLLPRMMQPVGNELLVNESNTIDMYSYRDTNGDGKADVKIPVYRNDKYVVNDMNMEHQRSGLDWNLDNWMYLTYDAVRFRYTNGKMLADTIVSGSSGQWGMTHDDYGRLFYSRAGGEIPALGFQINPKYGTLDFPDQYNAAFAEVWPIIATPDVQGGLPRLRPNQTLNHFTAPTGQSIYRGDQFPADFSGDYLVCEPVARAVRRAEVVHQNGKTTLRNVYQNKEFLSSSDMNFRPVNSATGPDGHLYIVDMHRGIIQQGNWTQPGSYLRQKIDSLGLAANVGHGRIYRIVHEGSKRVEKPKMLNQKPAELLAYLGHANGWWRDNAQKELITRADQSVVPALKEIAAGKRTVAGKETGHLAKIHALWTLEGMQSIDTDLLATAMNDPDARVRKTAVWISEPLLRSGNPVLLEHAGKLVQDTDDDVRVQLLLSLYNSKSEQAKTIVNQILENGQSHEMLLATKTALDKNENVRTFGSRLGQMDEASRKLIINGAGIFKSLCASCHGADAKGLAIGGAGMAAPPLAGSPRLEFTEKNNLIRIVLKGLTGPVEGKEYTSIMPVMEANSDEWIASVVSYIRHDFGGRPPRKKGEIPGMAPAATSNESGFPVRKISSPVVTAEEVRKIREESAGRKTAWTIPELKPEQQE